MVENKKPPLTRGRPEFVPTEQQRMKVQIMAACGMSQQMICDQIVNPRSGKPIDMKTLRKTFRTELDEAMNTANALVVQSLFKKATGSSASSVTAAIFWLKCRAGWKPVEGVELTGRDGQPIASSQEFSDAQLDALAQKMRGALDELDREY